MTSTFALWTTAVLYRCGLMMFVIWFYVVLADKSNNYHIDNLCDRKRSQQLYKKIDGAVLTSDNKENLNCLITFQTDSVLQKFMLRFEDLKLGCNDHLYVYDGAHAYGNYKVDLSCHKNEHQVGTIYTRTNFVTLKYVTYGWDHTGNGFKLVLTAFKDTPLECRGFRCENHLCIHHDLTCDRVNHCADNSDESSHAFCLDADMMGKILGLGVGAFIIIVVVTFIACFVCVSGVAILVYKHQRRRLPPSHLNATPTYPFLPKGMAEENAYEKPKVVNTMNSVSVFHSAAGLPPSSPPSSHAVARGEAPAVPRKLLSTSERDRVQCSPGKSLLPNKMKNSSSRSQKSNSARREKGEWLV